MHDLSLALAFVTFILSPCLVALNQGSEQE